MPADMNSADGNGVKTTDERTPLLTSVPTAEPVETAAELPDPQTDDEDVPLPKLQMFLLCYTRLVEPIAFFSIFPYINSMIERVGGVDKEDVGFYSGLIESLFSVTQMCVMILWGKASDRYGRKPCLVISLFGITFATVLFGLSRSLAQMIIFRCIAGIFAGTIVTVRVMISENCTKKTQARAFSYFAFVGNIGIFLGPLLGGALERPAEKFPSTFGKIAFFHEYPYVLPGIVCSSIGLSSAIMTALFVKETVHLHRNKKNAEEAPMSMWELIKYPGVRPVMLIYIYGLFLAFAYTAVMPVFLYTPVSLGGIGFSPEYIAGSIGLNGVSQAVWTLLALPRLHARYGNKGVLYLCVYIWPFFFALDPICNAFLRADLKAAFWTVGPLSIIIGSAVSMSFTINQLMINDIAPTHTTMGTLNGIVLAMQSGLRAVIPALSTALYAIGVKYNIAYGQLFWIVATVGAILYIPIARLTPPKASETLADSAARDDGEDGGRS